MTDERDTPDPAALAAAALLGALRAGITAVARATARLAAGKRSAPAFEAAAGLGLGGRGRESGRGEHAGSGDGEDGYGSVATHACVGGPTANCKQSNSSVTQSHIFR